MLMSVLINSPAIKGHSGILERQLATKFRFWLTPKRVFPLPQVPLVTCSLHLRPANNCVFVRR